MSRNTRMILIVVGVVLALCVCSCVGFGILSPFVGGMFLSQSMATDPAEVAAIGSSIVDYEVPPGYETEFGMSFLGFDLIGLTTGGEQPRMVIFLMQFPE